MANAIMDLTNSKHFSHNEIEVRIGRMRSSWPALEVSRETMHIPRRNIFRPWYRDRRERDVRRLKFGAGGVLPWEAFSSQALSHLLRVRG